MRAFLARLRDTFRRRQIARAFDEEMSFHVAELERQHRERGASPDEARAAAQRDFGNVLHAREDLRSQAGFPTWDEWSNDLRFAWRGIVRRPTLSFSLVAILALGLAAAATIHGLIDAVFLRPLPVSHPEELYAVVNPTVRASNRLSRGTARRLEEALPPGSVIAYGGGSRCTVQIGSQAAFRADSRLVNGSLFSALGVAPAAGRLLGAEDDRSGAPAPVVVVSYPWAEKNFGNAQAAIGRELLVNQVPLTIVGVLPEQFRDVVIGDRSELWFATALQPRLRIYGNASITDGNDRKNDPDWSREERISWLQLLVRVRPDSPSVSAALQRAWEPQRDELLKTADDAGDREQLMHRSWQLVSAPGGQSHFRDGFHSTGWLLGGVVVVMLVLVCTNVSGLLLVRSMSRHREIGVRLALGAGSLRVVRLGFLEAMLLSLIGAAAGACLATWLLPAAVHLLAPGQSLPVTIGLRTLAPMTGLALLTAVLSGLAPALWISRVEPLRALAGNRGLGRAPIKLGRLLVVAQFALAVALVAVAAALGSELQRSLAADAGFEREKVVTAVFDASSAGYQDNQLASLIERIRAVALRLPAVRSVSFSSNGVLAGSVSTSGIYIRDPHARVQRGVYQHDGLMPGYFGVMGVPILVGRDFSDRDTPTTQRVAIVNAAFAREIFGDRNPIGQSFGFDLQPSNRDWTIVGVTADIRVNNVRGNPPPMFYTPAPQWDDYSLHFVAVRFDGPEGTLIESLRTELARAEPGLVFSTWKTLAVRMTDDLRGDLATTRLAALFGGCALLLAGAGVAGSLGYLVVLRQRELALRMAIGAAPDLVLRSVLRDALRLSVVGGTIGLLLVWLVPLIPAVAAILYARPGFMPGAVAALVALLTAFIAGWFPARRAARIDPILLLKSD